MQADFVICFPSMGMLMILPPVRTRRQIKGAGKDARKRLLRIKTVLQADVVNLLIGIT